jgi:23S rRNA (guanosine2251-2'-O)-methyltransferase
MVKVMTHPDNDPLAGEDSTEEEIWYYQCTSHECNLRFPGPANHRMFCPICKSLVVQIDTWEAASTDQIYQNNGSCHFSVILDNLRSAYNVGSILRTADGSGIRHAYLCGISPTPRHSRLAKTALSAEIHTSWSYHPDGVALVRELKVAGTRIIGLETSPDAVNLLENITPTRGNIALVVGNEIYGIDPGIQQLCDQIFFLPMLGIKKSLNVAVSFGIAAYLLNQHTFEKHPVQSDTK